MDYGLVGGDRSDWRPFLQSFLVAGVWEGPWISTIRFLVWAEIMLGRNTMEGISTEPC